MHVPCRAAVLAAILLGMCVQARAAPEFRFPGAMTDAERAATLDLLGQASARLPPAWAEALDRPIDFTWRGDLPEGVHGRALDWRIGLASELLDGWRLRDPGAGERDPGARKALAATIHELAHLYDRTPQGRLSSDPRLLDLAGWQVAALWPGRRTRNDFRDRSADDYELQSPREYVAVNLEHYLLDPEYACRRPALSQYFDDRFGRSTQVVSACAPGLPFVRSVAADDDAWRELDPSRIYQVDYLLAEGNERAMSRWGHSMLRLVVCAPGRELGPDCRLDLQHHLVLSFRAFVDDVQISSWRGLTGSYPSRLFALPLGQVVDEYTRVELRGLRSVPLDLSSGEIEALATRAAQLHWNYDGKYLFATNNCAVETFKLLHDAVPRLALLPLDSITPNGLMRRLQRHGVVADTAIPGDKAEQIRLGYWFESASAHHDALYAVARKELALAPPDAAAWLALPPQERTPALQQAGLRGAAALLVLESAALRRQQALALDELKRHWLGRNNDLRDAGELAGSLQEFLRLVGAFSRPASWLEGVEGYGLPQAQERSILVARVDRDAIERKQQAATLEAGIRQLLPPAHRDALQAIEDNVESIGDRLRELAAPTTR